MLIQVYNMTQSVPIQEDELRLLLCGDVVGKSGRQAVLEHVPHLRDAHALDAVVVNVENAAAGFGVNEKIVQQFTQAGVDVQTLGDHAFDQKDTQLFINRYPNVLRPANFPKSLPGAGHTTITLPCGFRLTVVLLQAQLFMKYHVDCPFAWITAFLETHKIGRDCDGLVVDFHGEATSERMAMGQYLDGKVSAVVGTHTHVPTNDAHVLQQGTAYQTDLGMCGDYNSVIGFDKDTPIQQFLHKIKAGRLTPAGGEGTLCGSIITLKRSTGLASSITPVKLGGVL